VPAIPRPVQLPYLFCFWAINWILPVNGAASLTRQAHDHLLTAYSGRIRLFYDNLA